MQLLPLPLPGKPPDVHLLFKTVLYCTRCLCTLTMLTLCDPLMLPLFIVEVCPRCLCHNRSMGLYFQSGRWHAAPLMDHQSSGLFILLVVAFKGCLTVPLPVPCVAAAGPVQPP